MKKYQLVSVVLAAVLCVFGVVSSFAAGYPPAPTTNVASAMPAWLPIGSVHDLMSYAKSRVAQASVYGGSWGPLVPGGVSGFMVTTNNPDIRVIEGMMSQQMLDFKVVYPDQQMYSGAYLMDEDYNILFYGENQFYLVPPKWTPPDGAGNIDMPLNSVVPIAIPGVQWAEVYVKNHNGNSTYYTLYGDGSVLYFPTTLGGIGVSNWIGALTVYTSTTNGVYDMPSGGKVAGTEVQMPLKASIDRLITLDDVALIYDNPISQNGQGHRSWYQLKITSTRQVSFYGVTTEGQVAKQVVIAGVGGNSVPIGITLGKFASATFTPGVYDVWFDYPTFDLDQPVFPWYYGGGMGGG